MESREIFAIEHYNGEQYDDAVYTITGVYEKLELAEADVKKLQIAHDEAMKEYIDDGYVWLPNQDESWKIIPITYHY